MRQLQRSLRFKKFFPHTDLAGDRPALQSRVIHPTAVYEDKKGNYYDEAGNLLSTLKDRMMKPKRSS